MNTTARYISPSIVFNTTFQPEQYGLITNCTVISKFMDPAWFSPLIIVSVLINVLLFYVTYTGRKKLQRHGFFFFCVINTLIINLILMTVLMWNVCILATGFLDTKDDFKNNPRKAKVKNVVWVTTNTLMLTIVVTMGGNICTFLFALADSAYVVGKIINRQASELTRDKIKASEAGCKLFLFSKKRGAFMVAAISWLVPFILCILTGSFWNCLQDNVCCTAAYHNETECQQGSNCSPLVPPLRKTLVYVVIVLWFIVMATIVTILVKSIRKMRAITLGKTKNMHVSKSGHSNKTRTNDDNTSDLQQIPSIKIDKAESNNDIAQDNVNSENDKMKVIPEEDPRKNSNIPLTSRSRSLSVSEGARQLKKSSVAKLRSIKALKFNSRTRCMIIISVIFFCGSFPSMLICFLTNIDVMGKNGYAMTIPPFVSLYLYTIAVPIVLLKYVPHIKTTLIVIISDMMNCKLCR